MRERRRVSLVMRIDSEQLPQHLKRGLQSLYTVYGEETLLALEAADRIRAQARAAGLRRARGAERGVGLRLVRSGHDRQQPVAVRRAPHPRAAHSAAASPASRAPRPSSATPPTCRRTPSRWCSCPSSTGRRWRAAWFEALDTAGVSVAANPVPPAACRSGWPAGSSSRASRPTRTRCSSWRTWWKAICSLRSRRCRSSHCCFRPER